MKTVLMMFFMLSAMRVVARFWRVSLFVDQLAGFFWPSHLRLLKRDQLADWPPVGLLRVQDPVVSRSLLRKILDVSTLNAH